VQLKRPKLPFISNLTGKLIDADVVTTSGYWVNHLRHTVQFSTGLAALRTAYPHCVLLEAGPGTTLSTLAGACISDGSECVAVPSMRHPKDRISDDVALFSALGRVWAAGVPVDWNVLHHNRTPRRVALPTYPFEQKDYWIE